ncbi:MAG TPA: PP2C family protein-serine/threonine phosphatase [Pseudonocardiaceae bacterium]|jgi:serine phosphatase RsbU (regulator of sigma subunit)|nr:PP2C family protein-serine/threonine phosphatase [Pseudonocardiaceae bacterium]
MSRFRQGARTDEELVRQLRETIQRQQEELRLHQSELEQTNAGLLALHAEVERQRQHSALLDQVSRTASVSLRGKEVVTALVRLIERESVADSAAVWTRTANNRLHRESWPPELPGGVDDPDIEAVLANGAPVVRPRRLIVALAVGPNLMGVLDLRRDRADFVEDDLPFVTAVAARAAVGLRNASEYERERELAERLQRAMLPTVDTPAELQLCARYQPAATGVNVGGDWFDAFTRPDGTVVLTVGDVTGHGLDAAVIMGKLQNVLRAYATEGHGPAETLRLTHDLLRGWHSTLFASAVVLDLDLSTGAVRWASAGHLPVLVADAAGDVRQLAGANAPLLGVPFSASATEYLDTVSPGTTLLLYTDGLVERRSAPIDTGLSRLATAFGATASLPADEAGDRILADLLGSDDHDDDVCLLLCRWTAEHARG